MNQGKKILFTATAFILCFYFLFEGLVKSKVFLAPIALAVVLALLLLPVARKMELWGIKRLWSSLLNVFLLFIVSMGFLALIGLQVQTFVSDWDKAKQKIMPKLEKLQDYVYKDTPLKKEDVQKELKSSQGNMGKQAMSFFSGLYSFVGDYLLTLIYVFFLLNYRQKFRRFILRLFPKDKRPEVGEVMSKSAKLTQGYLYGKFILMIFLAILYAIGMGVTGVSNFIIISLLAALLSIIPYIGNIIGFGIALGLGYVAEGDTTALIGIVATFFIVQFVETYFFEPYVVGDNVNLDPFMTILVVVLGNMVWGVMGMVLSIPVLAIINVVFMHVKPLKPYSYLLSNTNGKDNG